MLSPIEDAEQDTTDLEDDPLSLDDLDFEELTGGGGDEEDLPVDTGEIETEEEETQEDETQTTSEDQEEGEEETEEEGDERPDSEEEEEAQKSEDEESGEEEPDSEEVEEGEEQTIIGKLAELTGYNFEDEEFSEDYEGIAKYATKVGEKVAEQELDSLFEEFPDVAEFMEYRLNGGDPEQYFTTRRQEIDYAKMELGEEDKANQEQVIRENLKLRGWEDQDIKDTIEEYKAAGILYSNAQRALKGLRSYQEDRRKELIEKQEKAAEAQEEALEKYTEKLTKTIEESNNLAGLPISQKDKRKFIDYLTRRNGEGVTAAQAQMAQLSEEQQLALNYLVFKGIKFDDIVNTKANTKVAQDLKKKLSKNKDKLKNSSRRKREKGERTTAPDLSELDPIF